MERLPPMHSPRDDPNGRMQAADPPAQPLLLALPRARPRNERAPYHEAIEQDLEDDLHLSIGKALALLERDADEPPDALVQAISDHVDAVIGGRRNQSADPTDDALALGCLFGHELCRALGWGWAHVRRTRSPGIVVISPDCRYAFGPRASVDSAFESREGALIVRCYRRLKLGEGLPESEPGRYVRLRW